MRRFLAGAVISASALCLAGGGTAFAQDPADKTAPPEFAPPAPAPVVDEASAEAFASRYAARNTSRFLGVRNSPRRVRVLSAEARCLEHPVIADRFGCVFRVRALVIRRNRGWDGYPGGHHGDDKAIAASRGDDRGDRKRGRRVRVREFGCLGLLRIVGGPTVTPQVTVPLVECARAPRPDWDLPEPTPVQ